MKRLRLTLLLLLLLMLTACAPSGNSMEALSVTAAPQEDEIPARMATMRQRQTHPPSSGIAMATNQCWRRSGGRFRDCRMSRMRRRC